MTIGAIVYLIAIWSVIAFVDVLCIRSLRRSRRVHLKGK